MTKNSHVEIGGNDEETAFSLPTKEKKIWHFVTGDKFEEKAFIKGKVKSTTTNGTKGNQNNWPTVAVIGRIPKRIDSIGLIKPVRSWDRGTRGLCVWIVKARERERERERGGKEATLRMLFQARSMEKRTWQLGFWASRPSRFNPTFSLLWVLFLFLPLCFLSFKYHFLISLLLCVVLGPHDVKVRIKAVGICGSDVHHFKVESSPQLSLAFCYIHSWFKNNWGFFLFFFF